MQSSGVRGPRRNDPIDDVEDSPMADDDGGGWIERKPRKFQPSAVGRSSAQAKGSGAGRRLVGSPILSDLDDDMMDDERDEWTERGGGTNPFAAYRMETTDFVIPKKKARSPGEPSPNQTPSPAEETAPGKSSGWPGKRPKVKEIDMSPTLQFGARRAQEQQQQKQEEQQRKVSPEAAAAPTANGSKKRGRLRRAKDDESSSSDSDVILVSPVGGANGRKVPRREEGEEEVDEGDSDSKAVPRIKGGKKGRRVHRDRASSLGASSDDELVLLSDEEGKHKAPASNNERKAGKEDDKPRREKEEQEDDDDDAVLILDDDEGGSSEDDDDEEARVQARLQKILSECEQISDRLMRELRTWARQDAGQGGAPGQRRQPEDRIGLTAMRDEDEEEDRGENDMEESQEVVSRTKSRTKRIPPEVLSKICPNATLKPYQLVGVQWLYLTYQLGVSGCLADEMGLGKTVQTIVFLAYLCHSQPGQTHLIIVPASVLSNWESEFSRFAPQVKVLRYHGSAQERAGIRADYQKMARKPGQKADVILTTYTYWERDSGKEDRAFFKKLKISYMVLDEGHSVKNVESQRFRRLRSQPSSHRLVLSGTPVQNAVRELLVLMHFLMPEVFDFGDLLESFFSFLSGGSTDENDEAGLLKLRRLFAPFVLRRLKADVLDQLTEKTTEVLYLPMQDAQANIYSAIRDQHMARLLSRAKEKLPPSALAAEEEGEAGSSSNTAEARRMRSMRAELAELLRSSSSSASVDDREARNVFHDFRKAANHPLLLRRFYDDDKVRDIAPVLQGSGHFGETCTAAMVEQELSGMNDFDLNDLCDEYKNRLGKYLLDPETLYQSCKFAKLRQLVPSLLGKGRRILLFSQWTKILDLLEELLDRMGVAYLRLDGSTPINERQDLIDSFNEEGSEFGVFLLSTRAGGLGLNLTGADTVILHDADWNPTVDRQAEDRAHRIGQTKPVKVFKLVTVGTVDERVFEIASAKLERSEVLLDKEEGSAAGGAKSDEDEAEPPLTIASLVRAELEKYLKEQQPQC